MKLYIIGNGFDLSHGMPTKYSSFIESNYELYSKKYSLFRGENWNQIESEIGNIINYKKSLIEEITYEINVDEITEDIISNYVINDYAQVNYFGYEHEELKIKLEELNEITKLVANFEEDFKNYLEKI